MNIEDYARRHKHYWSDSFNNKELGTILDSRKFARLIDVGCGDGILLYQLNRMGYLDGVEEVWAVDLSSERLKDISLISPKIRPFQSDAQHLDGVPDSSFDLVISTQVIEHVENDFEMMKSLYRIARPGAIVYLDTVFKERYGYYFYKNDRGQRVLDPTHQREYTDTYELIEKARAANFEILQSSMNGFRFSPLNFVFRLIRVDNRWLSGSFALRTLQRIKVPIIGYKCWKIVLRKPPRAA
ncbi:MAG: class I SAM-dependent methyltransferase [Syntrophobacteraceae bacterium]